MGASVLLLSRLSAFSSRPYHHGDMDPIKAITAAAEQLAAAVPATAPVWQHCMQALLEVLFMHSSRPLHKQLLSSMRKLPQGHQAVVAHVVQGLLAREATGVRGMSHFGLSEELGHAFVRGMSHFCHVTLLPCACPPSGSSLFTKWWCRIWTCSQRKGAACCLQRPMLAAVCCAVLCCAVLCCAVLCCAVLRPTSVLTSTCCVFSCCGRCPVVQQHKQQQQQHST
jgi:hypothetical protein